MLREPVVVAGGGRSLMTRIDTDAPDMAASAAPPVGTARIRAGGVRPADRALLFTEAHTAHSFDDTPIDDAQLREIWELARWAPTSANTQPLRVLFVRQGAGRERLVQHMSDGNKAKTRSAPAVAVLSRDTRFYDHLPTVLPIRPGMREQFAEDPRRAELTGSYSAALQAGYFLLAVRAVGLAAGPMGGFDRAGVDGEFFPDGRLTSTLVVNIGHPGPDAWYPRLPRLAEEDVVSWA